jgi:nucleoside-diphosphate-sugar epimerase
MKRQVIFDKKNILIIGGAGFIGSNLIEHLLGKNKIICIDNFITGNAGNIDYLLQFSDFAFIKHDMSDPIDLENLNELQKFRIEWQGIQDIIYLACPTSYKDPKKFSIETIKANSVALQNALDLAIKYDARFLFASSSAIYGDAQDVKGLISEDYVGKNNNLEPRAAYNEGKRFAETTVYSYFEKYNLDISIARIFSTYGPRMILNDGRMIPDFIEAAMKNKDIIINGNKKETSSFCYITDMIDALLKLMDDPHAKPINLGDPKEISIVDIAKKIIELTGSKSKIIFKENFDNIQRKLIPDITNAKEILGWIPMTDISSGLKTTIEHVQRQKKILSPNNLK